MEDVKLGPSGGDSGLPIEGYVIPAGARICEVQVTSGWFVDSIRLIYTDAAGATHALPGFGGNGSHEHRFTLEPDEYLVGISGRSGRYVDNIVFHTNLRISPAYGGDSGENPFAFLAPENSEVVGFFGRADWYVDAIGIVTRALPAVAARPGAETPASAPATKAAKPKKTTKNTEAPSRPAVEEAPKPSKKGKQRAAAPESESAVVTTTRAMEVVAAPAAPDNLEIIEGIGPKIAALLAQNGIVTFAGLADAPAAQLRTLLLAAGRRFAVSDPTTWPAQAALAAAGDMDALKAMQANLKGGRKTR